MNKKEYLTVMAIIAYIAFFTNPPPSLVSSILQSSIGRVLVLLFIVYTMSYQSLIIGIFMSIAYIISASRVTEHLTLAPKAPKIPVPRTPLVGNKDGPIPVPKSALGPAISEEELMAATRRDIMEGRDTRITPDQLMGKAPISNSVNGNYGSIDFGALKGMDLSRPVSVSQTFQQSVRPIITSNVMPTSARPPTSESITIGKPNIPVPKPTSPSTKKEGFGNFAAF